MSVAFAVVVAALSTWSVWEQDIFWQVRAGAELLDSGQFPQSETWSYTVAASDWQNVHWLSTVLFALTFRWFGIVGLIGLRALLAGGLIYLVGRTLSAAAPRMPPVFAAALLALVYFALAPRIQVRPEMLALLCYCACNLVWLSRLVTTTKCWLTTGLMLLVSNFHASMTPFLGLLALTYLLGAGLSRPARFRWCAGLLVAAFCNPQPFGGLRHAFRHLFYFSDKLIPNPEQQRATWAALMSGPERWHLWASLVIVVLGVAYLRARGREDIPGYGRRWLPLFTTGVLLALCAERTRATPFVILYAAPLAARLLERLTWRPRFVPALLSASFVGLVLAIAVLFPPYPFGFEPTPQIWPVESVAFIKRTKPQANVFHTFSFGSYLDLYLPEYKVFGDTRETPFREVESEYLAAYESREGLSKLVARYDINTLLLDRPKLERLDDASYFDVLEAYAPSKEWALVFFDAASVVLVKRSRVNAPIVQQHEYRWLRPSMPADEIWRVASTNPTYRQALQLELDRCLHDVPGLFFCERLAQLAKQH